MRNKNPRSFNSQSTKLDLTNHRNFLMATLVRVWCVLLMTSSVTSYGTCDGCWCVPGSVATCPPKIPQTNFSQADINGFAAQKLSNPFQPLTCNPYKDPTCGTSPPQQFLNVSTAVCAFVYSGKPCATYALTSFASAANAQLQGAHITHLEACGLCSTAQDLSVYMAIEDLTTPGKKCGVQGVLNEALGLKCFENLGFTTPCAQIWNYDAIADAGFCGAICATEIKAPDNGPPPLCPLNKCLQCDEDKAGPLFKSMGGRSRRNSGLIDDIVRPCESVANLTHIPCPL